MEPRTKILPAFYQRIGFIFFLLLIAGAGCGKKDDTAVLCQKLSDAVTKGYLVEVQKLVREHPKLVNIPNRDKMKSAPLHVAVNNNRFEIADFLLQNGADINARNDQGMTALHLAAMNGNTEIAEMLLSRNARKDIRDWWGQSALMYATKRGHADIVKLLK